MQQQTKKNQTKNGGNFGHKLSWGQAGPDPINKSAVIFWNDGFCVIMVLYQLIRIRE
ncbi:hypothetical protein BMMGA3_08875 [Bacillus methanolicus MGA3]|uniref:Uncharacterized protein n=1 Tax=Bacillus methanolicus (strain MGA3 / ATCC 53907) TaxID=796606 RepID=A0A068LRG1_BACMM|nr:hypothetical protein BMMGA3_08875 [Bacillus methanolicus MGA3]